MICLDTNVIYYFLFETEIQGVVLHRSRWFCSPLALMTALPVKSGMYWG